MWCKIRVQVHSLACEYPIVPTLFFEETVLSSLSCLDTLIKDHLTNIQKSLFLGSLFYAIGLFVITPVPHCLDYYGCVICLKSRSMSPPTLFFIFKIVLAIRGPLRFPMNFKMNFCICTKNAVGILIGIMFTT